MNEATATLSDPGLRLELGIRGAWKTQVEDICVIDTDAPSHCHRTPNVAGEEENVQKAGVDKRGTFTPFVLSVDGLLHIELLVTF